MKKIIIPIISILIILFGIEGYVNYSIAELDNILKLIIITIYFLLLAFELINTAIEMLSDKISKNFDSDIKKIKDISSASVFIILILLITSLILATLGKI